MAQSFMEQPSFIYDPISDVQEDDDQISKEAHLRSANTAWCTCTHCCVLPTIQECTCCLEIPNVNKLLGSDCFCIVNHPVFHQLCLDDDRLDLMYRFLGGRTTKKEAYLDYIQYINVGNKLSEDSVIIMPRTSVCETLLGLNVERIYIHVLAEEAKCNKYSHLRKTAYRAFIAWVHGSLHPPKGKPIPACVVNIVRTFLPYPEELNRGFMKIYDYAASDMALD